MAEETPVCGQTDALWFPQMNVAVSDFNEEATQVGMQLIWRHISLHGWGREAKKHPAHWTLGLTLSEQLHHTYFSLSLERNRKTSRVLYIIYINYSRQSLKTEAGRHLMANS